MIAPKTLFALFFTLWLAVSSQWCTAQEATPEQPAATETRSAREISSEAKQDESSEQEKRFADFGSLLKKSALVGTFTIDGEDQMKTRPERYEISKVVKQAEGDYWNFFARIQYGTHDVTLPIPVEVKWAGSTPVITVDNLTIPGMGTFDARVVISDNKYAGTWRHGKVGGLMYGHIEQQSDKKQQEKVLEGDSTPASVD